MRAVAIRQPQDINHHNKVTVTNGKEKAKRVKEGRIPS